MDLAGWEPVDALVERVVDAVRGGEGLGRWDRDRLIRWPAAWRAVHPEIRAFYRDAIASAPERDRAAVHCGLTAILDGISAEGWARGTLARLHRDLRGHDPGFDLCEPAR